VPSPSSASASVLGWDPFGEALWLFYAVLVLVWCSAALRRETDDRLRREAKVGMVAGAVLLIATAVELAT
jgi:hypothetical protein